MINNDKEKFINWCIKIQYQFLQNDLLQAVGLELSSVDIVLETDEEYLLKGLKKTDLKDSDLPLAYFNPRTDSIHIYIDHESFKKRTTEAEKVAFLMFLLYHEACHRLLMHKVRGKEKEPTLWNIVGDMEIHNMLYVYNELLKDNKYASSLIRQYMHDYIEDMLFIKANKEKAEGLFEKEFLQNTAEEMYVILDKSKEVDKQSYQVCCGNEKEDDASGSNGVGNSQEDSKNKKDGKSNQDGYTVTVTKTTYKSPSGKKFSSTIVEIPQPNTEGSEKSEKQKHDGELTRKSLMENALKGQLDKMSDHFAQKGDIGCLCKTFLGKLFKIKIDWKKILRNSLMTALEKSEDFTWAKPRTSLFALDNAPYLPSQYEDETAYGTVIIARDESGSMSDDECRNAASIINDAKEHFKKIVLLKHDTDITSVDEIEELDKDALNSVLTRNSCGGTSHEAVFKFIKEYSKKNLDEEYISCCIFITDLYSDIETTQHIIPDNIPRIYLVPSIIYHSPEFSNFQKDIRGKIIPIEL